MQPPSQSQPMMFGGSLKTRGHVIYNLGFSGRHYHARCCPSDGCGSNLTEEYIKYDENNSVGAFLSG